jgi:hypothetical protein
MVYHRRGADGGVNSQGSGVEKMWGSRQSYVDLRHAKAETEEHPSRPPTLACLGSTSLI